MTSGAKSWGCIDGSKIHGRVWLLALFASADGRAVGDDVESQAEALHGREQAHGCVWEVPLVASADGRAAGDDVGNQADALHGCEQAHGCVWEVI